MTLNWGYILIIATTIAYLVVAFVQYRRAWLIRKRVSNIVKNGKRAPARVLSYGRDKYVEVEYVNHSDSRVLTNFRINKNEKKGESCDIAVLMSEHPNDSPAIVLEYNSKPIVTNISKYILFAVTLTVIAVLLLLVFYVTRHNDITSYAGIFIPIISALAIFIGVTEDEMAQNRGRNMLLLYGLNANAQIRKASSTGIVKEGYKQISFFLVFEDENGESHFGKAEEPIDVKDYQFFREEKKVDILYSPERRKGRCLLNYTWQ